MKKCLLLSGTIGIVLIMLLCPAIAIADREVKISDILLTENTADLIFFGRFSEMGGIGSVHFGNFPRVRWQKLGTSFHLVIELDQKFEDHGYVIVNGDTYSHPDYTSVKIPILIGFWRWDSSQSELLELRGIGLGVRII